MKRLWMDLPFFFFPFQRRISTVMVKPPPLLSAVSGSRNASMFPTELPHRTVPDVSETWGEDGEEGVALSGGSLTTTDSRTSHPQRQYELLSVPSRSWCPFYLLGHVFSRGAPSRRVLITGSITSPSLWRVTSSEKVCRVSLSPKLGSNKEARVIY